MENKPTHSPYLTLPSEMEQTGNMDRSSGGASGPPPSYDQATNTATPPETVQTSQPHPTQPHQSVPISQNHPTPLGQPATTVIIIPGAIGSGELFLKPSLSSMSEWN